MNKGISILLYFLSLVAYLACGNGFSTQPDNVPKGVILSWEIPVKNENSHSFASMKDSILIYYRDDLILYRVPYVFTQYNQNAQHGNTNIISDDPKTIDFREVRFQNFIYRRGEAKGILYDSRRIDTLITFDVDSFQRKKTFKDANLYDTSNDKLVDSKSDGDKLILTEKYVNISKPDESYSDTSYYYFNTKLNDIEYSFSRKADSSKHKKLSKMVFIYNGSSNANNNNFDGNTRKIAIEIKRLSIENISEIQSLFNDFKKDRPRK